MLGVVNKIKNMKVRTKIRLLVGLGIAVIVLFTMQIMSISEKIGTYVGLTAEELAVKSKAIVAQGIVTGLVFEVMLIALPSMNDSVPIRLLPTRTSAHEKP